MDKALEILVIDDDSVARKVIGKSLDGPEFNLRFAEDGETGLEAAFEQTPDIIILDVEMPGLNGYEVCINLRDDPLTVDVPVIFLSSHGDLRARMQGYEVGGNDYLVKPFEAPDLAAKINVLAKYSHNKQELKQQYDIAQQTAFTAMSASSELGEVMLFVERSYELHSFDDLALSLFNVTDRLNLNCALLVMADEENLWFSSDGTVSPLEQELVVMSDRNKRFVDFGARTIVHFSDVSILSRNMPLDDPERYGRIKDLLPVLLAVVNAKANTLKTELLVEQQSIGLQQSIKEMRSDFFYFANGMIESQKQSEEIFRSLINALTVDFLKLGLEEDQEDYVIHQIEHSIDEALEQSDSREKLYFTLKRVHDNIKTISHRQQVLIETFEQMRTKKEEPVVEYEDDGIELF